MCTYLASILMPHVTYFERPCRVTSNWHCRLTYAYSNDITFIPGSQRTELSHFSCIPRHRQLNLTVNRIRSSSSHLPAILSPVLHIARECFFEWSLLRALVVEAM